MAADLSLTTDETTALVGVPETALPAHVAASFGATTPGAPWRVRMRSLMWLHPASAEAASALPSPLLARARGVTNAGFVRYEDTPVGAYNEVIAAPVTVAGGLLGRVHVPFIAVDSVRSVQAGREHWALPKVLARFDGTPDEEMRATGDGWWVHAAIVRRRFRIPLLARSSQVQVRPDGRVGVISVSMRGVGRVVTAEVDVDPAASFAAWLRPGRHRAMLVTATMTVGEPRWSAP